MVEYKIKWDIDISRPDNGKVDEQLEEMVDDYVEFVRSGLRLMIKKRHDYGTENVTSLGDKGVFVRIWDKVHRLKRLLWDGRERAVADETIDDTVQDLFNYAFILYRVRKRGYW